MFRSHFFTVVIAVVITGASTYFLVKNQQVNIEQDYIKKSELNTYIDQYMSKSSGQVYAAFLNDVQLKKQQEQEDIQKVVLQKKNILENDPLTPFMGNSEGDVKIVMFSDYQCIYCKKSEPLLKKITSKDSGVKFAIKEFPILGDVSIIAAKAALSVFKIDPAKYSKFNSLLFESLPQTEAELINVAQATGIDEEALFKEMLNPEHDEKLAENQSLAAQFGITGTPAFIVDGVIYPGALPEDQLIAIISNAREKRTKLLLEKEA